jgi:hypothetical protein
MDRQTGFLSDEPGRGTGSAERVAGESLAVPDAPCHEAGLHLIVSDEGDVFGGVHDLFHSSSSGEAGMILLDEERAFCVQYVQVRCLYHALK